MGLKTPLFEEHQRLNAKIVDFAGWDMPLHYGSQLEEHQRVRQHAGIFDVSHMNIVDIRGKDASKFLQYLFANDIAKLTHPGLALYTCMLNQQGGIIDDLIVYFFHQNYYRLVLNAGTRERDMNWIKQQAHGYEVDIQPQSELAIIALQGPAALSIAESVFSGAFDEQLGSLKPFQFITHQDWMLARTGYTGEDGLEIILPPSAAVSLWRTFLGAGAHPTGLGARDTLRLEAGYNLYGQDMDETTTPFESNLAWTVALDPQQRQFIGREALVIQKQQGISRKLVGLVLEERGVLRHDQTVIFNNQPVGSITSGSFSPTLNCSIAMARVKIDPNVTLQDSCQVDIRGKLLPVRIVKPAFVRKGQKLI